ncbi:AbrB/MazE/SpoVT family DNA-binding domain-containing protein [Halorussus sp. MSC15.2]|uniref:AbrB/MazE/SpoVT family DNA-binding domain-containing protein n=1 Tax=Halorussus sp. MSC15.2 TaxID=2283638 RepID=UPI0013D02A29|nr:AbrB/MazE/SpoVT family DNA-binding domain-containing protein [Halorussus sp. MSC15.2]NEU56118.1 AbrB/MazE/SpoVT family DNA-binding domain-containing protein [Halorussus sp. MSC15.2]
MSSDDTEEKILGTTTVTQRWRISLIKAVREEFAEDGLDVEEGDRLVYKLRDGQIVIEPA